MRTMVHLSSLHDLLLVVDVAHDGTKGRRAPRLRHRFLCRVRTMIFLPGLVVRERHVVLRDQFLDDDTGKTNHKEILYISIGNENLVVS